MAPVSSGELPPAQDSVIRAATTADVDALVELRALMLAAMGSDIDADNGWRAAAEEWFTEGFTGRRPFCAYVAEDPVDGVVSSAVGYAESQAPSHDNPSGVVGHIFNVSTHPHHRGRGLASQCFDAVTQWFAANGVAHLTLSTTPAGESIYGRQGFSRSRFHRMTRNST